MRILSDSLNRKGQRQVKLVLDEGEALPKVFKQDDYYRLGGQTDLIVGGHVINEARHIYWCSIEQEWITP